MRTLLFVLMISFSSTALADWERIGEASQSESQLYIDTESVKQTGPMAIMRRVWELKKYAIADNDMIKSVKRLAEYDCMDRQYRVLQELGFTDELATGEPVHVTGLDNPDRQWRSIQFGSAAEIIFDKLCPHMNDE